MEPIPATAWTGRINPHSAPDLSSCLEEGRLALAGTPIQPSPPDVDALRLVEWALARRQQLGLVPIDPVGQLTALLPAAIHVANIVHAYMQARPSLKSSVRVAVVSSDYRTRGRYRSLEVANPAGGRVPLRSVVPAATRGRGGVIRALDGQGEGWSTLFLGSIGELLKVKGLDVAIVELPVEDEDRLPEIAVPSIIVARDPTHRIVLRLAQDDRLYAWNGADLAGNEPARLAPRMARLAQGAETRVILVPSDGIAVNASLFWDDIGPLVRASRNSPLAQELARLSFGVFYDLVGLALPTRRFETEAGRFDHRLDAVSRAARQTAGDARDVYLPMVECELRDIAREVGEVSPKTVALLRVLREHASHGLDTLLVARTAALARAYQGFLADSDLPKVRVASLGGLSDVPPATVAVLTGPAPTWGRWVYAAGIASTLEVLAYDTGSASVGAVRRTEAELAKRTIEHLSVMRAWLARPAQKARAWTRISGESVVVPDDPTPVPADMGSYVELALVPEEAPPDVPVGLWDGGGWLLAVEPGPAADAARDGLNGGVEDLDVLAVLVRFDLGRSALLAADGYITRYDAAKGRSDPGYPVRKLARGDQVVFIDDDSRKDQLAKVLEVADQVPELAVASGWVSYWRHILGSARRRFATNDEFAEALRACGCRLQTQSVRLWVVGNTIGPDDPMDVRRVGEVAKDSTLHDHYREVHRSMDTLRRAHQRLGQRIGSLARQVGVAAATGQMDRDEVIDERSGLTAADFEDSIDIVTVESIESAGEIPVVLLGRLSACTQPEINCEH